MRRLNDKLEIRRLLNADRAWALYALADLDDGMFDQCDWWGVEGGLALVFHGISIRPIFVMGDAAAVRRLLAELPETSGYLNLQTHTADAIEGLLRYDRRNEMCRMILEDFVPRAGETAALTPADGPDVERLFASGSGAGIAFSPSQLETGYFRGVRDGADLIAVAGLHVVSANESAAGVGNVFVRADWRGRGLAQIVLSAVSKALRDNGIRTIGLNVEHTNEPAIRAYEKLGFRTRFRYFEGAAERITT